MAQHSPRSLKHEYEVYVENEIENYKESVSRSAILKIGDEAAASMRAGDQFVMDIIPTAQANFRPLRKIVDPAG
jgi:hypothetical protein